MIGKRVGHYLITARIGAGGMGQVYLAEDTRLERRAAIKFLPLEWAADQDRRDRFFREAKAASALNHPNVCVVYDVGETEDGIPFIAMEHIEGTPLDIFVNEGSLEVAKTLQIVLQVVKALDAAHSRKIIHRDIKPGNISVDRHGHVKVLDFGLAKRLDQDGAPDLGMTGDMQRTQEGTVLGTPTYMSPEQALGRDVDHRTDLFSVGIVLYRMLTGLLPFNAANFTEIVDRIVHTQPVAIARLNYDVPPELERITLKCLQKSADQRYQSARELAIDLENLSRELTLSTSGQSSKHYDPLGVTQIPSGSRRRVDPEEISQSDVVITYADLDNRPMASRRQGWISQLEENLQVRVAQLSGKQVTVLKQSDVVPSKELEAQIIEQIPKAKTVVSVLSPPFVQSDGCHRLVESFWKHTSDSGEFRVGNHSRLLNIVKTPVEDREIPPEIRSIYTGLVPYEFFERDPQSGRLREFDETFGDEALHRFHERVYDVAYDVAQILKYLGEGSNTSQRRTDNPKTVFLAATTSDLQPQRDQLRRELTELGHDVIPKQPLPLVASELVNVVKGCLEQADVAIHFVGEYYGMVPEATELSVVALQNQVAAEFCGNSQLKRLIWIPKDLSPTDERQISFIRQLESEPSSITGAELIADTLENLKALLRTRWEREAAATLKSAATACSGAPRVYVICDQEDEEAIEPIEDYFYDNGIEVSLPGFEASEADVQQIHIQNLKDCDGALIYYGAAGMHWVDFKIRDLQKAAGYRDSVPISVSAVYLAPPFNRRKERFKSLTTTVLRQTGEAFDPLSLSEFVEALRLRKEVIQ